MWLARLNNQFYYLIIPLLVKADFDTIDHVNLFLMRK